MDCAAMSSTNVTRSSAAISTAMRSTLTLGLESPRFHAPLRLRARHILLAAAADDVNGRFSARSRAEELIAELKQLGLL